MGEEQRKAIAPVDLFADLMSEFEEKAAEAACNGLGKSNAAGVLEGKPVFLADALDGSHLGFAVVAKKREKALALHRAQLG